MNKAHIKRKLDTAETLVAGLQKIIKELKQEFEGNKETKISNKKEDIEFQLQKDRQSYLERHNKRVEKARIEREGK